MGERNILPVKGALWRHRLLQKLARSREFPARLRLFGMLKNIIAPELLFTRTPSGLNLLLDLDDWVQSRIYFKGNYEPLSLRLFKALAENAVVILDVGAHVGQYILECAVNDPAKVKRLYAVEMNPKTFTYLLNNIQLNAFYQVTAILGAVDKAADLVAVRIPEHWNPGTTRISASKGGDFTVASFALPDLLKKYEIPFVDLLKIDVEGHELSIISSLFDAGRFPANIIFEFIPDAFADSAGLISLLKENGYRLRDVNGEEYDGQENIPEQNLWALRN